jgi:hypothetical protein
MRAEQRVASLGEIRRSGVRARGGHGPGHRFGCHSSTTGRPGRAPRCGPGPRPRPG